MDADPPAASDPGPRSLDGRLDVDVAIVGAGACGLWGAALILADRPGLRVAIVDAARVGHGGSAASSGCCSPLGALLDTTGHRPPTAEAFTHPPGELAEALLGLGIESGHRPASMLAVATDRDELRRLGAGLLAARQAGLDDGDVAWCEPESGRRHPALDGVLATLWWRDGLLLDPVAVLRRLAGAVRAAGGVLFEDSTAVGLDGSRVRTLDGELRADAVICAAGAATTELAAASGRGTQHVRWRHLISEPLDELAWARLGWARDQGLLRWGAGERWQAQRSSTDRLVWSSAPRRRGWPRTLAGDRTGRDGGRQALRLPLPATIPVKVASSWSSTALRAGAGGGVGRDRRTGVHWLISDDHDMALAWRRARDLVGRLGTDQR